MCLFFTLPPQTHYNYIKILRASICQEAVVLDMIVYQRDQLPCITALNVVTRFPGYENIRTDRRERWGSGTSARSIQSSQNCTLALRAYFHVSKSKTRSQCTTKVGFAAFALCDWATEINASYYNQLRTCSRYARQAMSSVVSHCLFWILLNVWSPKLI
jgi:hypothetical protein